MVGPQAAMSSSLCINDTAVMKRVNMKKGDIILEMGRCLKNVLSLHSNVMLHSKCKAPDHAFDRNI